MSDHHYSITDELRKSTRVKKERGTDSAVLWIEGGEPFLVDVHDESLGGIALYVDDVESLKDVCEIDILYAGQFMRGYVRHIQVVPEGGYVVGFECDPVGRGTE